MGRVLDRTRAVTRRTSRTSRTASPSAIKPRYEVVAYTAEAWMELEEGHADRGDVLAIFAHKGDAYLWAQTVEAFGVVVRN